MQAPSLPSILEVGKYSLKRAGFPVFPTHFSGENSTRKVEITRERPRIKIENIRSHNHRNKSILKKKKLRFILENPNLFILGPLETIKNNETGFLVNQTAVEFAQCMAKLVENQELYLKMKKKVCYRFF